MPQIRVYDEGARIKISRENIDVFFLDKIDVETSVRASVYATNENIVLVNVSGSIVLSNFFNDFILPLGNSAREVVEIIEGYIYNYTPPEPGVSDKVKVSSNDTTAGYLEDKIVGTASNISITTLNDGADEDSKIDLINTAVTPGDYMLTNITVDANGRITAASNGSIGNYAQTANSATINTVGEQSIVGTGVGSLSIPANIFAVGDSFHGKMGGLINATGGGGRSEITIKVKTGTTILASTGVFDLDTSTNQGWEIELDFTIAAIGATGTICTNGNFAYTKDNNRAVYGYIFQDVQPIDTTASNTLDVTVEWNVLNGGDDIYSANFVLYKVY